uniref:Uncharacterized protein n=1 Tax=Megaselia scalaris TaxID=36166 RepID=T1GAK8_MEGSC
MAGGEVASGKLLWVLWKDPKYKCLGSVRGSAAGFDHFVSSNSADEGSIETLSKKENKKRFSLKKIQMEIIDFKVKDVQPNNPASDKPSEKGSLMPEMEETTLRRKA